MKALRNRNQSRRIISNKSILNKKKNKKTTQPPLLLLARCRHRNRNLMQKE